MIIQLKQTILFLLILLTLLFYRVNEVSKMFANQLINQDVNQSNYDAQVTKFVAYSQPKTDNILITYPKAASANSSSIYSLTVNGQPIFVEQYNSTSYAHFAFAGKVDIEISVKENVNNYTLSPKSYSIQSNKNGNKISFSLNKPRKLILHQVNSIDEKLVIIADPPEDNPPRLGAANIVNIMDYNVDNTGTNDITEKIQQAIYNVSKKQGVLYFPPGKYKTKQLNLASNMTLYLAGGSILEATTEINPSYGKGLLYLENASNTKIVGRGVINGNGSYWRSRGGWYSTIIMSNTNNINLEDIIIRDTCVANVWMEYSENNTVYNVKIIADPNPFNVNSDGFDFWSSRNITVDNAFYRGTDDATSQGGDTKGSIQNNENINVKNSVFYTNGGGAGAFVIGVGTRQRSVKNVNFENIDVVNTSVLIGLWPVAGANFENIYFKNIRVENIARKYQDDGQDLIFQWHITPVEWEPNSAPEKLGYIKNIYLQNVSINDTKNTKSLFQGYDKTRRISNVNIENFYLNNKLVSKPKQGNFTIVASEKDGKKYVEDFTFTNSKPTILSIRATKDAFISKSSGEFLISRTGNLNRNLIVNYIIRGTAKNGKDYQSIRNSVTIPAGKKSAKILIKAINNHSNQRLKTVFISLDNQPYKTQYMLDVNHDAVVNIRRSQKPVSQSISRNKNNDFA